jgi:hypothetical protein
MRSRDLNARFADDSALRRWIRRGIAPALAAAVVVGSMTTPGRADDSDLKARANMGDPIAADVVASNPQIYVDKRIFVEGYVDDMYGSRLFEIEKEARLRSTDVGTNRGGDANHGHDLLIYVPEGMSFAGIEHNKKIRVVGTLHRGLDAPGVDASKHDLKDRAVLVAEMFEVK